MLFPAFRKDFWISIGLALCLLTGPGRLCAQAPPQNEVITWDGQNGISLNSLVGADRFYSANVWGQSTVTANVEAGLIWSGHEVTSTLSGTYVADGAAGEVDMHATWVGSVLGGYNPNSAVLYYYQLGMAPVTQLESGAIATNWYNETDPVTHQTETYFHITPQSFYSGYNHYFTQAWTHTVYIAQGISTQFSAPTDVINSSWGFGDPTGQSIYTLAADGLARANPLTALVVAAGNSNTATNSSNNVGGPASGFNSISVGAAGNFTATQFTTVADFSSRGPQDYYDPVHGLVKGVRAPVDIVAPGTTIYAAFYGGQTGGNGAALSTTEADPSGGANNWYTPGLDGTSFASPIVAGGVSLLKSLSYNLWMGDESRDTRVIKAVLMNSATKLPGWNNGQQVNASGVTVTTQSLDWSQGAGMLNLNRAFDQYIGGTMDVAGTGGGPVNKLGWDFGQIQKSGVLGQISHNDYAIQFTLQHNAILDVTLTWFRNIGLPTLTGEVSSEQTLTTSDLGFANLNVEIWNAGFTHLYAASQSKYNNVQALHFTLTEDGAYGIRVTYADQMFGDPIPEDYGLAWSVVDEVPEPGVMALSGGACLILFVVYRKRRRNPADE